MIISLKNFPLFCTKFDLGIGSERWAAPETISANPFWSEKADIFSLGMTFYEIVTGNIPFYQQVLSFFIYL
jgi:serine/threonine protein kinase